MDIPPSEQQARPLLLAGHRRLEYDGVAGKGRPASSNCRPGILQTAEPAQLLSPQCDLGGPRKRAAQSPEVVEGENRRRLTETIASLKLVRRAPPTIPPNAPGTNGFVQPPRQSLRPPGMKAKCCNCKGYNKPALAPLKLLRRIPPPLPPKAVPCGGSMKPNPEEEKLSFQDGPPLLTDADNASFRKPGLSQLMQPRIAHPPISPNVAAANAAGPRRASPGLEEQPCKGRSHLPGSATDTRCAGSQKLTLAQLKLLHRSPPMLPPNAARDDVSGFRKPKAESRKLTPWSHPPTPNEAHAADQKQILAEVKEPITADGDGLSLRNRAPLHFACLPLLSQVPEPKFQAIETSRLAADGKKPEQNERILTYPAAGIGAIEVLRSDLNRLQPGECLNDTLVEFGLRLWLDDLCNKDPALANEIHVFNSFFFKKLKGGKNANAAYENVRKWTSEVDLFAKKCIIIPIHENFHWYLAVIYRPQDTLPDPTFCEMQEPSASHISAAAHCSGEDLAPRTKIFTLDSLGIQHPEVVQLLSQYIKLEARDKRGCYEVRDAASMRVWAPLQPNSCDCGIYLLQFAKVFMGAPAEILQELILTAGAMPNSDEKIWKVCEIPSLRRLLRSRIMRLSNRFT